MNIKKIVIFFKKYQLWLIFIFGFTFFTVFSSALLLYLNSLTPNYNYVDEVVNNKTVATKNNNNYFHSFLTTGNKNYGVYNKVNNRLQFNGNINHLLDHNQDDLTLSAWKGETLNTQLILVKKNNQNNSLDDLQVSTQSNNSNVQVEARWMNFVSATYNFHNPRITGYDQVISDWINEKSDKKSYNWNNYQVLPVWITIAVNRNISNSNAVINIEVSNNNSVLSYHSVSLKISNHVLPTLNDISKSSYNLELWQNFDCVINYYQAISKKINFSLKDYFTHVGPYLKLLADHGETSVNLNVDRITNKIEEIKEKIELNNLKFQKLEDNTKTLEQKKQNIIDQEWETKPFFERIKAHLKLIKLWDNESHCDYNKMQSIDKVTKINKKLKLQKKLLLEAPPNSHITQLSNIIKNEIELKKAKEKEINSRNKIFKRIYENIFLENNEIYFRTIFVHADQSITEKIMFFMKKAENNEVELFNQINTYKDINEYQEKPSLIQENLPYKKIPLKAFINEQIKIKLKPTKTELILWTTIIVVTIAIIIMPFILPHIWLTAPAFLLDKATFALTGVLFKSFASMLSTTIKKVDSWFGNKLVRNQDQKDKDKKEFKTIIKDLNSDKLETKLEAQYNVFKKELDIRKSWKINKLLNETDIQINKTNKMNCSHKYPTFNANEINSLDSESAQSTTNTRNYSL